MEWIQRQTDTVITEEFVEDMRTSETDKKDDIIQKNKELKCKTTTKRKK